MIKARVSSLPSDVYKAFMSSLFFVAIYRYELIMTVFLEWGFPHTYNSSRRFLKRSGENKPHGLQQKLGKFS